MAELLLAQDGFHIVFTHTHRIEFDAAVRVLAALACAATGEVLSINLAFDIAAGTQARFRETDDTTHTATELA